MKYKILLSTATAIGLAMGTAWAGSNNKAVVVQGVSGNGNSAAVTQNGGSNNTAKFIQDGSGNNAVVTQAGNGNSAGDHLQSGPSSYDSSETARGYNFISQHGNNNGLAITQTQNGNFVARDGKVVQTGDRNSIDITQHGAASAGGRVNTVLQTAGTGATSATNKLTVLQEGAVPGSYTPSISPSDYNYAYELITKVEQINTGGAANELTLTQKGGVYNRANTITSAYQNGADNQGTVTQVGRSNLLTSLSQTGAGGNRASVAVTGDRNGAGLLTKGAAAAGATTSTVTQTGTDNLVDYTANGNDNQFGFYQDGQHNEAVNVQFNGSNNELGVYQRGVHNTLSLATINDSDNVFGVNQVGVDNNASINSAGGQNGGYNSFTAGPAGTLGLTPGLLSQEGTFNQVSLTINGAGNVFASLQNNSGPTGTFNKITASQSGNGNQAAVMQMGNANTSSLTQTGGMNNASISQ
jgi:hypothetical protein